MRRAPIAAKQVPTFRGVAVALNDLSRVYFPDPSDELPADWPPGAKPRAAPRAAGRPTGKA